MDLHADQIQGFFNIPIDNIYAQPVLVQDILDHNYQDVVVVSPDVGGVARARAAAKRINDADLAIIDKRRPAPNLVKVMNVIGDVEGKHEITTAAGTIRCVGTGSAFEIVFQNLRQLVRATRPFRSGPARLIVDRLLATAAPTDIEVKLRIGRRIVADVETPRGQDRSHIRLRFLNLVAAAFRGS